MKKLIVNIIILILGSCAYAQLPAFTLDVTAGAQTCLGNGTLTFTVAGNNPAANMSYAVYLLPNTTSPVTTVTTTTVTGLTAGNYQVVATQSLGAQSNTATDTATIINNIEPVELSFDTTNIRCSNDGAMSFEIESGNVATFEILSGPVTRPPQASADFNNLPAGEYQVRIFDLCGEAIVITITVEADNPLILIDDEIVFQGGQLPGCNLISVGHYIGTPSGSFIFYPITLEYTIMPPGGGAPVTVTKTVTAGSQTLEFIEANIPFYNLQEYSYDLTITDACGNEFTLPNNEVIQSFLPYAQIINPNCTDYYFKLGVTNFVPPYTVTFTQAPAGFDPNDYNAVYPGPFTAQENTYGSASNPVPFGNYTVQVTDACRTATANFEITRTLTPVPQIANDLCSGLGIININAVGYIMASVSVTAAPAAYPGTLPYNVSEFISADGLAFSLTGLPEGNYTLFITDTCGRTATIIVHVEEDLPPFTITQRRGCDTGYGSVRFIGSSPLTSVAITSAPPAFTGTLPVDVSANIGDDGYFYMNSLPAGTYIFTTIDDCATPVPRTVIVEGYQVQSNNITVIPNCNSFNLNLQHTSNGNYVQSFWLQKLNPVTGTWGHPQTGNAYTEGNQPAAANSVFLSNNTTNVSLAYTGHFRVIKAYHIFSNGSDVNFRCTQVLGEFDYEGGPAITGGYSFPCIDGTSEVAIIANGVPPLNYSITTKDGQPFTVNNGTFNVFDELESAIYNFQVTDNCGNIRNIQLDINALDPVAIEPSGFCEGELSTLSVQPFPFLTYEWYEQSTPGTVLSTTNVLTFPAFDPDSDLGTYVLEITSGDEDSCMNQVLQYQVVPVALPNAGEDDTITLCNTGATLNLEDYLSNPHTAGGVWQDVDGSGALTGSTVETAGLAQGSYQFRYTVAGTCSSSDEAIITIVLYDIPQAPAIDAVVPLCEGEDLQFTIVAVPGAVYEWTGPDNFTSNLANPVVAGVTTAAAGTYTVVATVNGCASEAADVTVTVNGLPQFSITGSGEICAGQSSILAIIPGNFVVGDAEFVWYFDDEIIPGVTSASIEVFEAGVYRAEATLNGCSAAKLFTISENANPFTVEVEAGCVDEAYVIRVANAAEISAAAFQWTGPAGFTANEMQADITGLPAGNYVVTVTSADGCTAQGTVPVDYTTCTIPRGISPNNDDDNDAFDLSHLDVAQLKIFNRYGRQIYAKDNYSNEWHGQSDNGGEAPTGTYYYMVTLSAGKQLTGWVYLQREIN